MARKKSGINNRVIAGIVGGGVILVVVVPVLFLVFGVGFDTSPVEGFEIPVSDQEQIETNQQLIDQASDLLCGGGGTGDPDPLEQLASDGSVIFDPNQDPCIPLGETDSEGEEVSPEEIDEMIEEIEEMIVDPPIVNQTTSEDPPLEQSCDIDPDNPLCQIISPSNSLQLISKVEKTDSQGVTTVSEEIFEVPAFAFLVEDPTDRDFRTGFLNYQLFLKGLPNTMYVGTGKVDLFVGDQSIFTEPTSIEINSVSDVDGMVQVQFLSPTGIPSSALLFTFDDEFDKFGNEQITLIRFNLVDLSVSDQTENFSLVDQDVFTLDIARDDIKLIIIDETGTTDRVYPTDSRIVITSKAKTIRGTQCLIYKSLVDQLGVGCSARNLSCPCFGTSIGIGTNNVVAGTTSPPSITGINLFDQFGQFLLSQLGGSSGVVFDELVTRNENYTLQILSPVMSADLSFGKPQQTQSFTCIAEGTAKHKITRTVTGVTDRCGAGLCNYYYYIVTDGVTTRATTCNFP
ncbi:MAG: hypothetical protein KJI69_05565 [Patescibacteria group bacterium]|nr:hypothetical protein [Patescibacteria group bacterium]